MDTTMDTTMDTNAGPSIISILSRDTHNPLHHEMVCIDIPMGRDDVSDLAPDLASDLVSDPTTHLIDFALGMDGVGTMDVTSDIPDIPRECDICFDESIDVGGCGNPKCSGRFCDQCMVDLSLRYIHTPRCCLCIESCSEQYIRRLTSCDAIFTPFRGYNFIIIKRGGPTEPNETLWRVSAPVLVNDVTTLQTALRRATQLDDQTAPLDFRTDLAGYVDRNTITWRHQVNHVRWGTVGRETGESRRYDLTNYKVIGIINQVNVVGLIWFFPVAGNPGAAFMCLVASVIITGTSLWGVVLQALYNDVYVLPLNCVKRRIGTVAVMAVTLVAMNAWAVANDVSVISYQMVYFANTIYYQIIAAWMFFICREF
jgi:hypothetical protein